MLFIKLSLKKDKKKSQAASDQKARPDVLFALSFCNCTESDLLLCPSCFRLLSPAGAVVVSVPGEVLCSVTCWCFW